MKYFFVFSIISFTRFCKDNIYIFLEMGTKRGHIVCFLWYLIRMFFFFEKKFWKKVDFINLVFEYPGEATSIEKLVK